MSTPADRRTQLRYPIPSGVKLHLSLPATLETVEADLVDISRNGIGVLTRAAIAPGTSLTFVFGLNQVSAVVRHSRATENGFVLGLLMDDTADTLCATAAAEL